MFQLPPWLALLALLLVLRRNRSAEAWWIWAPLLASLGLQAVVRTSLNSLPSRTSDIFFQTVHALTFGVAALWLVSAYLGRKHRFVAFLGSLLVVVCFSTLACLFTEGWADVTAAPVTVMIGIHTLIMAAGLSLSGFLCRRRYQPLQFALWLVACLAGCTLVVALPFFILVWVQSRGQVPILEFLVGVSIIAGLCLSALLPFLVLAFANTFYRERLKDLLLLDRMAPPPMLTPPPTAPLSTSNPLGPNVS